jgi:hypothetical protein
VLAYFRSRNYSSFFELVKRFSEKPGYAAGFGRDGFCSANLCGCNFNRIVRSVMMALFANRRLPVSQQSRVHAQTCIVQSGNPLPLDAVRVPK